MTTVYKTADEVDYFDIASDLRRVLDRHERFKPIIDFDLKIDLLLAFNSAGDAVKLHGAPALAKIKIVGPEDRARGNGDVRIVVDALKYERRTTRQRDAILCHELYHIAIKTHRETEKDINGDDRWVTRPDLDPYERPVVKLVPDDWTVTGFRQVAEWYGDDSAEARSHRAIGELLGQLVLPFAMAPGSTDGLKDVTPKPIIEADRGEPDDDRRPSHTVLDAVLMKECDEAEQRRKARAEVKESFAPAPVIEPDVERQLEAESDADAADGEAIGYLSAFGVSDEVLKKLDEAEFYLVDALVDSIDGGDLAEDCEELTEDEIDQVIAAVRKATGNKFAGPNRGNAQYRQRTRDELQESIRGLMDDPAVNDHGVYDRPEEIEIPLTKSWKCKASVLVAKGNDGLWRACRNVEMPMGKGGGSSGLPNVRDNGHPAREAAIRATCEWIADVLAKNGHDKAAYAVHKFRDQHPDPAPDPDPRDLYGHVADSTGEWDRCHKCQGDHGYATPSGWSVCHHDRKEVLALFRPCKAEWERAPIDELNSLGVSMAVIKSLVDHWAVRTVGELADCAKTQSIFSVFWLQSMDADDVLDAIAAFKARVEVVQGKADPAPVEAKPAVNKKAFRAEQSGLKSLWQVSTSPSADHRAKTVRGNVVAATREEAWELAKKKWPNGGAYHVEQIEPKHPSRAELGSPDMALFTVHPNGNKNAACAVRAPSLTAAIHWANEHHPKPKVKPDRGDVARLGLKVVEVTRAAAAVPDEGPVRICNRCDSERPASAGVCPACKSPEFRLKAGPVAEAPKPKRQKAAAGKEVAP